MPASSSYFVVPAEFNKWLPEWFISKSFTFSILK